MTIDEYRPLAEVITSRAEADDDACLLVYFSAEDDEYLGCDHNMDSGDALLVIRRLMRRFEIDPEIVAAMSPDT